MSRYWRSAPTVTTKRLKSKPYAITFTVNATRNDGTRCYVQETHEFHLEASSETAIIEDCKRIAAEMRDRMQTYLDPMCMCRVNQTVPCPVNHARKNTP